jgi:glycosyltransferase involved in cell wall biosynthesis
LRVSVLVHNGVMKDARVIKQALTLERAGHQVTIHGISPTANATTHYLPGTEIPVLLEPPIPTSKAKSLKQELIKSVMAPSRMFRYGVMWPLQLAELGSVLALAWWFVRGLQERAPNQLSEQASLAIALLLGAVTSVAFGRFRRWQWKVIGQRLRRGASSATKKKSTSPPISMSKLGHTQQSRYHRLSGALLNSLQRHPAPEVVHLHDHVALSLAGEIKARFDVQLVWDAHEIYEALAGVNPERAQENAALIAANQGFVDHFITINASIARFYKEHYPELPTANVVMNAAVAGPMPQYDGRLHAAAALPRTQQILLFQGGFGPDRGLPQLVEAAFSLPPEWTLVMMGWGPLETELRALASQAQRADDCPAVVFLPGVPQQELQQWTAGATIGVIPYENTSLNHLYCTPNKLWEYPAAGVPVLASDLVEMATILEAYPFGFLLPREFTSADIVSVVTGLSAQMITQARANASRFLEANNWSVWEKNLLAVYQEIGDNRVKIGRQSLASNPS